MPIYAATFPVDFKDIFFSRGMPPLKLPMSPNPPRASVLVIVKIRWSIQFMKLALVR